MKKSMLFCGVVLVGIPLLAAAKNFPLAFKTLSAKEAMSFPGGSGLYASLQVNKPSEISRAPKAVSSHPIYGVLSSGKGALWFRIDESGGDGKGYDRLIVDMNRNGDLTDDPVIKSAEPAGQAGPRRRPEVALFGPIPSPADTRIGDWQPIYFARMYLYTRPSDFRANRQSYYLGQLRFKAGWYLETAVEFDGVKRRIGIVDGNCNFRLGESPKPRTYRSGGETNWYFYGGDYFVEQNDTTHTFKVAVGDDASVPFGPVLYLGPKLYKAVLAADSRSLALMPWSGPLAELALRPHGEQVSRIQVAWESAPGRWQLLEPGIENGKAKVPPGRYRLYTSTLKANTSSGRTLVVNGYKRSLAPGIKADAGVSTPFPCGAPLEIKTTVAREKTARITSTGKPGSFLESLFGSSRASKVTLLERIQASVWGAGGEMYSSFNLLRNGGSSEPAKPKFTVLSTDGKEVTSGNMEFG